MLILIAHQHNITVKNVANTKNLSAQFELFASGNKAPVSVSSPQLDFERRDIMPKMIRYDGIINAIQAKSTMNARNVDSNLIDCEKEKLIKSYDHLL